MKRIAMANTPPPRLGINVGAGLDIPAGTFIRDFYGDDVLMGGMTILQGEVGDPNSDKTMIMLYMVGAAANTMAYSYMSEIIGYDSEGTLRIERVNELLKNFEYLDRDEYGNVIMNFKSISEIAPEEWFDKDWAGYIKSKRDTKDYDIEFEFLADPNEKSKVLVGKLPTLGFLDTMTFFDPSSSMELILGEHKRSGGVNDSSTKTLGLNNAKFKTDVMSVMSASTMRTNTHLIIVAHMGDNINIDNNPYGPKQRQQIASMASNEKIKGVPSSFTRLTTSLWQSTGKTTLYNQNTKLAEYPLGDDMDTVKEELSVVTLKQHRSKDNFSRGTVEIVTSQRYGVQPHLSNFRALKRADDYGFIGNKLTYSLVLYPDVKLSRTTVRPLINEDPKLRRALELSSDYLQMTVYHPVYATMDLYCGLETLYKDIDEMGYCWDKILTKTRNWWTPKQYSSELKYLNILNLLKIRKGLYNNKETLKAIKKDK